MKTILIISPESWDAHTVSKHHYAMALANMGLQVYFLNPPDRRYRSIEISRVEGRPNLQIVSTRKVATALRFFPSRVRRIIEKKWLDKLERAAGRRIDVIWLFENSRFFDLRFADDRLKIYHQVDLDQNFNLELAASTADICFCTTELIKKRITRFNNKVYKIHHGLAEQIHRANLTEEQSKNLAGDSVNAVYIGNLDIPYLDSDLLFRLAKRFEGIRFHFVGNYTDSGALWRKTGELPNITWWGKVESSKIPSILEKADILLVAYKSEFWQEAASPHKFMEYFFSGKTIVATYTEEYRDKTHLLEMVEESRDYLDAFQRVVSNLSRFNDDSKAAERKEFALAHTYEKNITRIDNILHAQGLAPFF